MSNKASVKKAILSGIVIVAFIAYSLQSRHEQNTATIAAPTSLQPANTTLQPPATAPATSYKDGNYTGNPADAFYGNIQVQVTISGGKITNVAFLQYPNDRGISVEINTQAMPYLKQEAIQAQNAQVDGVSGATDTSQAFMQSLSSALSEAKG